MDIGDRLKNARENKNLEQKEVANLLKVSISTVSGWENSYRTPPLKKLIKLAKVYETSLDYLVGFEHKSDKEDLIELIAELKKKIEYIETYINNTY